jgi:hypothetical protein
MTCSQLLAKGNFKAWPLAGGELVTKVKYAKCSETRQESSKSTHWLSVVHLSRVPLQLLFGLLLLRVCWLTVRRKLHSSSVPHAQ